MVRQRAAGRAVLQGGLLGPLQAPRPAQSSRCCPISEDLLECWVMRTLLLLQLSENWAIAQVLLGGKVWSALKVGLGPPSLQGACR